MKSLFSWVFNIFHFSALIQLKVFYHFLICWCNILKVRLCFHPAFQYCSQLKGCQCGDGAGRQRHHTADRCGPVTVQLIKLKHYDSPLTLSPFVSFPAQQSSSVLTGRPLACGRAWMRRAYGALGCSHKKHSLTSPGSDTAVQSVAVTWSMRCLLLAGAINKDPHLSTRINYEVPSDCKVDVF